MQRRDFIKIMTAGGTTLLVPSALTGCDTKQLEALEGWNGPSSDQQDIRILVLSYAVLAANPHNKQPWLIRMKSNLAFDLYVDRERLLPETDPPARQIHIGQGTFLENLAIAATHYGYRAHITYFPQGMYSNTTVEVKPVASIELQADTQVSQDPLFDYLLQRQSNKRAYTDRPISASSLQQMGQSVDLQGYTYQFTQEAALREPMAEQLGKAMEIETAGVARHVESMWMFRFNDEEVERYRDGFSVANSGVTGFKKFMAETFFLGTREESFKVDSSMARAGIDLTYEQARSAAAFGWLISKTNTRLDQVKIGRVYERLNLEATRLGLAMHPMSQILEEYEDMALLQRDHLKLLNVPPGHTVQMLFRLGYAEPVIHSPRRLPQDFILG